MSQSEDEKVVEPTLTGGTYPATVQGFARFLIDANDAERKGYALLQIVRLDTKIAAVYRRGRGTPPGTEYLGFFEE